MSQKRAGGIFASSFIAGLLLAGAIYAPRAWEPVPGPYFGLDDRAATTGDTIDAMPVDAIKEIEAAHAELSARVQASQPPAPVVQPPAAVVATPPEMVQAAVPVVQAPAPVVQPSAQVLQTPAPVVHAPVPQPRAQPVVAVPPERVAVVATDSPAAAAALASILPPAATAAPAPVPSSQPVTPPVAQPSQPTEPPESLKGLMTRMQAAQPAVQPAPQPVTQPATPPAGQSLRIAQAPTPRPSQSWSQALSQAPAVVPTQQPPANTPHAFGMTPGIAPGVASGVAPLPGEPWNDPDGVNWSDIIAAPAVPEADRRRTWIGDWRGESRGQAARGSEPRAGATTGRLLDRLRGGDRRLAHLPASEAVAATPAAAAPPDISRWPRPVKLEQQLDHLVVLSGGEAGNPLGPWIDQTRAAFRDVHDTRGPRDAAAESSLIALGETVIAGMSLADTTIDSSLATRRATARAVRRVCVARLESKVVSASDNPANTLTPSANTLE
ncbi:MAG: hypothetical protein ACKOK8_10680 [Planctomycetia bacterium]